jgi:hypothetical protein
MPPIAWLAVTLVSGVAAYLVALPAWRASRSRATRDENAERYLAWRGRASRGAGGQRPTISADERRRLVVGAALAVLSVVALVAFFATS